MPVSLSQARWKYGDPSNPSIAQKSKRLFRHLTSTYSAFTKQRQMAKRQAAARTAAVAITSQMPATTESRYNTHVYYSYAAGSHFINGELWEDDPILQPPTYDDRDQLPHYSADPCPPQYEDCEKCRRRQIRQCEGTGDVAQE